MKKNKDYSFSKKLIRLEEISAALDNDEVELEDAIALYEEGIQLAAACMDALNNAELKITTLQKRDEKNVKAESNIAAEPQDNEI